ncbi:MAG: hypothetical protein E7128_04460 [Rikenellaceae bacterium]|nr:hypothetical protein [Rikenellaceae bacterium]
MKKLFLLLAAVGVLFTSCETGVEEPPKPNDTPNTEQPNEIFFEVNKQEISILPYGGSVDVIVYSNYAWVISGTSDWCTPSVTSGEANEDGLKVTFSADVTYDDREATFWLRCADKTIKLVVKQNLMDYVIRYTTTDGKVVDPQNLSYTSNTYENGQGMLVIHGSIIEIGRSVFSSCSNLTRIIIPEGVVSIGSYAFAYCTSLTSITIPDSVTSIGDWAFHHCSSLTSITIPEGVTEIGNYAFYDCRSLTNITIPDGVTKIGWYAFGGCTSLTNVTIGNGVTEIGESAFEGCSSLTNVTIGNSVTEIGESAFSGCSSLKAFYGEFASEDGRCLIIDGTLNSFAIGCGATEYTIPEGVTEIGGYAFDGCTSLTNVTIGNGVTEIGESAFSGCSSLKAFYGEFASEDGRCLIIDGTLNSFAIGCGATEYTIPEGVTEIGSYAFDGCRSLTSITIPESVTKIGISAFDNCSYLESIYCKPTTPPAIHSTFYLGSYYVVCVYVPRSSYEEYIKYNSTTDGYNQQNWYKYESRIRPYDFE